MRRNRCDNLKKEVAAAFVNPSTAYGKPEKPINTNFSLKMSLRAKNTAR